MQGWPTRWSWVAGLALTALVGCAQSGVGDPCIPEAIPAGGYDPSESYIEASSVQCRTRTCVVHQLSGDPREITPPSTAPEAITMEELEEHVFCSCRCDAPEDVTGNFELCKCPSGFICEELLAKGGDGERGSYCVKDLQQLGAP